MKIGYEPIAPSAHDSTKSMVSVGSDFVEHTIQYSLCLEGSGLANAFSTCAKITFASRAWLLRTSITGLGMVHTSSYAATETVEVEVRPGMLDTSCVR